MKSAQLGLFGLTICLILITHSHAAFIVEPGPGGKANANFASTDGVPSVTSGVGTAVGLSGATHVFGGNGLIDEWTFSYTPGTDADNTVIAAGTVLGNTRIDPPGNPAGVSAASLLASGLTGGASGTYNVYVTSIPSGNVDVAGTTVTITSDDVPRVITPVNWNSTANNGPTPSGVGAANQWLLVGSVDLTAGTTYEVVLLANNPSFVSQRSAGVMWELAIPEPSSAMLVGLTILGLCCGSRRRV